MITLNDLIQLEIPHDEDDSDEELDEDQEDVSDEAEGGDLVDAIEEDNVDAQNGHSPAAPTDEGLETADQLEDDVEYPDFRSFPLP
jgi:hypothetical protein